MATICQGNEGRQYDTIGPVHWCRVCRKQQICNYRQQGNGMMCRFCVLLYVYKDDCKDIDFITPDGTLLRMDMYNPPTLFLLSPQQK